MAYVLRARNPVGEHCAFCGVPAGTACRDPFTGVALTGNASHPVPVDLVEDARVGAANYVALTLQRANVVPAASQPTSGGMPPPIRRTLDATPLILLDEPLPNVNGTVIRASLSGACANPAMTERKFWEKRAFLVRTSGTWSVLGGVLHFDDENATAAARQVPTQTGGMSAVTLAPSLPGGDLLRATATGLAATDLRWVVDFTLKIF
jgi:hypothetical protein